MVLESGAMVFAIGASGGVIAELLHWWNLKEARELPEYAKSALYWVVTILMILAGGFVAWLYFGEQAEAIIALHVGISTPLILQKLVTSVPQVQGGRNVVVAPGPSIRRFFTW